MANYALPLGSPIFKAAEADGTPLSGGKLFAYESDGVTPKTTWNSGVMSAETANINPVILDSRGEAWIFGTGLYLFVLKDSSDVEIWTSPPTLLLDVTDKARALLDDTSFSAMRTTLGLGTAATYDAGDEAGEVVLLESSGKLPAIDGSQLTDIASATVSALRGYLAGMALSRGANQTISVAAGIARDSSNVTAITLSSGMSKTFSNWVALSGNGGLDTGTISDNTWYHVWSFYDVSNVLSDVLISAHATSPTMPSGYTLKRRIGSFLTDGTSFITGFDQLGDEFLWDDPPLDVESTGVGTTKVDNTLTVPTGVQVHAIINVTFGNPDDAASLYLSSPDVDDEQAASSGAGPLATIVANTTGTRWSGGPQIIRTNTSAQIRSRNDAANASIDISTLGWVDRRGRDD